MAASGKKLWGGRFSGALDPVMNKFNESLSVDQRMWAADIQGSKAYAKALAAAGVITADENAQIQHGLDLVHAEWADKKFVVCAGDEDIHTANERRLTELIGSAGGKLHTGRSRNDQVATDVRLYVKEAVKGLSHQMGELLAVATHLAETHMTLLMPGFTHLQPAQPIRFSHWVMSHVAALQRDVERLNDLSKRVDVLPLGSGALAGHSFGIDRALLASELGFARLSPNSLDAVCDRDFIVEFMFWASMTMIHFSQLSEDLIIYNTLKFVTMADAYSTGSSLMPQKKNPDALELLRGKSGAIIGRLNGFMITLKGLPRSYNKDLQEDKAALFYCIDSMVDCIQIAAGVLATLTPHGEKMRAFLVTEMLATDLAEYLVRRGVPFRETHHVAGAAVRLAEDANKPLSALTLAELQSLHSSFAPDVMDVWNFDSSVERKNVPGGTSAAAVKGHVESVKAWLAKEYQL
ncbi:argininosuccinate lyase [Saprolegnia diclina VS20]|uniref:Argininosuccinate lyase n=1 Tax=Saprolegnia diclina (strain VS20) TaxID=1156394 RepID=T0QEM2_SAPDV|nr:argininosuccinate lyase [Saprolegnia diclina VS20]EQC33196.1 argininosuccinate lyase [Saprolegnia diclina VS20]|eukprot:XP_008613319.1 argininosuccinate lyase [Saprolegnia diclina VS20]